jgi:hypothetical protein
MCRDFASLRFARYWGDSIAKKKGKSKAGMKKRPKAIELFCGRLAAVVQVDSSAALGMTLSVLRDWRERGYVRQRRGQDALDTRGRDTRDTISGMRGRDGRETMMGG